MRLQFPLGICKKKEVRYLITSMLLILSLLIISCEKGQLLDFAKRTGKTVTVFRPVEDVFTKIYLNDDVNLVITQGAVYEIKLEGGENLLSGVETNIIDSTLTIRNKNTFNWLRSYDYKITAYVTLPDLLDLRYEATSTVSNTDTLRGDSLFVVSTGGSGYINMLVDFNSTHFSINNGSVDMNISGKSGVNYIFSNGYGPFHCSDLKTTFTYISNFSSNDCYINVDYLLEYKIKGLGNIYYKGDPVLVPVILSGEGKLIHLD
jgi:hypothetical protein